MRGPRVAAVAALGLALALGACGDDEEQVDAGAPTETTAEEGIVDETPADEADPSGLQLEVTFTEPLVSGQPVAWELEVTNVGADETVLTFADGRSGDAVLADDGGAEVYRWSDDQMFTQAVRDEPLAAGETTTFELEEPMLDVEPGNYGLTVSFAGDPSPEPMVQTVEVS